MEELKSENLQTNKPKKFAGSISAIIALVAFVGLFGTLAYVKNTPEDGVSGLGFISVIPIALIGIIVAFIYSLVSISKNIKEKSSPSFGTIFGLAVIITFLIFSFWMFGAQNMLQLFKLPFLLLIGVFK